MTIAGVPGSGMSGSPGGHVGLEFLDKSAFRVVGLVDCQPLCCSLQTRIQLFKSGKGWFCKVKYLSLIKNWVLTAFETQWLHWYCRIWDVELTWRGQEFDKDFGLGNQGFFFLSKLADFLQLQWKLRTDDCCCQGTMNSVKDR